MPAPPPVGPPPRRPPPGGRSWAGSDCAHTELSAAPRRPWLAQALQQGLDGGLAAGRSQGRPVTVPPAPPARTPTGPRRGPPPRLDPGRPQQPLQLLASAPRKGVGLGHLAGHRHGLLGERPPPLQPGPRLGHVSLGHEALQRASHGRNPGPRLSTSGSTGASSPSGLAISARLRSKAARPSSNSPSSSASVRAAAAVASPRRANSAGAGHVRQGRLDPGQLVDGSQRVVTMRWKSVDDDAGRRQHLRPGSSAASRAASASPGRGEGPARARRRRSPPRPGAPASAPCREASRASGEMARRDQAPDGDGGAAVAIRRRRVPRRCGAVEQGPEPGGVVVVPVASSVCCSTRPAGRRAGPGTATARPPGPGRSGPFRRGPGEVVAGGQQGVGAACFKARASAARPAGRRAARSPAGRGHGRRGSRRHDLGVHAVAGTFVLGPRPSTEWRSRARWPQGCPCLSHLLSDRDRFLYRLTELT